VIDSKIVAFVALLIVAIAPALPLACSGAQVREAATCSPKADAWFAQELVTVCRGRVLSECPESDAIGETYEGKAELECSKQ